MTADNKRIIIIKPEGAQGGGFSAQFSDEDQFKKFDEAVGELPLEKRKDVAILKETAHKVGVSIIDE